MRMQTKCTPAERAAEYLKRIAALTGAKQVCGDSYRLKALLQLKNNARLFEKWREWPARTFKANGKMLRDPYQLTRDET